VTHTQRPAGIPAGRCVFSRVVVAACNTYDRDDFFVEPFAAPFFAALFFPACESALPAAVRDFDADRPSRSVSDDFVAAFVDVFFAGALRCDSALPAPVFDFGAVSLLRSVLDAAVAAFLPVSFDM
jgi:hypothetical protein